MNFIDFRGFGVAIGLAAVVSGCVPPVVWDRPGATPAQLTMDSAQCQLYAERVNPDPGIDPISTGKVGRDIAVNLVAGLVEGVAEKAAIDHTVDLCMQGLGYAARAPGAIPTPPMALAGSAPPPAAAPIALAVTPTEPIPMVPPSQPATLIVSAVPLEPCGDTRSCYREPIVVPAQ